MADVLGRRAAAAADDPRAGVEEAGHGVGEVLRAGGVDELARHALRQAGVGDDAACQTGRRAAHLRQRVEADLRADAAVDADRVDAGLRERGRRGLRAGAVDGDQVLAEGHLGDDRQVGQRLGLLDADQQLAQVAERLEQQEVDAALEQALDLLAERGADVRFLWRVRSVER